MELDTRRARIVPRRPGDAVVASPALYDEIMPRGNVMRLRCNATRLRGNFTTPLCNATRTRSNVAIYQHNRAGGPEPSLSVPVQQHDSPGQFSNYPGQFADAPGWCPSARARSGRCCLDSGREAQL